MKADDETLKWLELEASREDDRETAAVCKRALSGSEDARAEALSLLQVRVARAHRAHRRCAKSETTVG